MRRPLYATETGVQDYYDRQTRWRDAAKANGCAFMPSVTPGFNNQVNRPQHFTQYGPMSRRLKEGDKEGSLFKALIKNAVKLVDVDAGNILMITSWNEYHEDTQIEPLKKASKTKEPELYTRGLEYEGYGTKYLKIVKDETT